ncbi:MAG: GMC family oxidoreductase [Alicyclobacillus sp.]|nr:GMC family oxidoreductase [Alicyclobacillus sp.]
MTSKHMFDSSNYPHVAMCTSQPTLDYMDHWIPLTPLEKMERTNYDVIIVGSGAGGGAVLWRLCDKWRKVGKRIAVIERGDLVLPTHAMNLPTFNSERMQRFLDNPKLKHPVASNPTGSTIPVDFVQYFAFGGRTLHWGTGSPRFHPLDFQRFPFTYRDLSPYYRIAERLMGVNRHFTERSYIQHILLKRLRTIGYPEATDFPLAIDYTFRKNGLQLGALFSSINLFGYALNAGSFDLAVNTRVTEILTQNGAVEGVKVITSDQKSHVIHGEIVVLAASTLENPRILLHSGIQNESIGRYLINHSCVEIQGWLDLVDSHDETGNVAVIIPRQNQRPYQVSIYSNHPYEFTQSVYGDVSHKGLGYPKIYIHGFGAVEPRFDNGIFLNPSQVDEYGIPKVNVHFTYGEQDQRVIRQMTSAMQYLANGIGLHVSKEPCLRPPGKDFHESGTCRMGNNPELSVTNQYGEVHQVTNVFIADSSVLPYIGGANPTLTIIAVAIRTADYILQRLES